MNTVNSNNTAVTVAQNSCSNRPAASLGTAPCSEDVDNSNDTAFAQKSCSNRPAASVGGGPCSEGVNCYKNSTNCTQAQNFYFSGSAVSVSTSLCNEGNKMLISYSSVTKQQFYEFCSDSHTYVQISCASGSLNVGHSREGVNSDPVIHATATCDASDVSNKMMKKMVASEQYFSNEHSSTLNSGKLNKYVQKPSCRTLSDDNVCEMMKKILTHEQNLANMLSSQLGDDSMLISSVPYTGSHLSDGNDLSAGKIMKSMLASAQISCSTGSAISLCLGTRSEGSAKIANNDSGKVMQKKYTDAPGPSTQQLPLGPPATAARSSSTKSVPATAKPTEPPNAAK